MSDPADSAVDLHAQDIGRGRPIVFLHGWAMSHEVWDRQVLELEERYRVVTVDLRGHGRSPKPAGRCDYEDHCADLERLFDRLELEDAVLVGWSMGGAVGAQFAASHTAVSQLVMVGAPPRFRQDESAPYGLPAEGCDAFLQAVRTRREQTMWRTVEDTFATQLGEAVHRWLYGLSVQTPSHSALHCFEGVLAGDVREHLRTMRVPVLLLHGVHDIYISIEAARWAAQVIPDAELVEFEHSGHGPFLEEPERFNRALLDFVERPAQ